MDRYYGSTMDEELLWISWCQITWGAMDILGTQNTSNSPGG